VKDETHVLEGRIVNRSAGVKLLASAGLLALVGLLVRSLVAGVRLLAELRTAAAEGAPTVFWLLRFGLLPVATLLAGVALYRTIRGGRARGWLLAVAVCAALPVALKIAGGSMSWAVLPFLLLTVLYAGAALIDGAGPLGVGQR
jgi:hypothetical protein